MKIKTIAAICKRHKHLNIYTTTDGDQWISDGCALYSMHGMPTLTPKNFLKIFDVPDEKTDEWQCNEFDTLQGFDIAYYVEQGETDIEPETVTVEFKGRKMWLFVDNYKIYAIDEEYLKPLFDDMEYLTFHKRRTESGGFILACKVAFELKAVILPVSIHTEEKFTDSIQRIGALYGKMAAYSADAGDTDTFEALHSIERDEEGAEGVQEYTFADVDPETGEIIEESEVTEE